MQAQRIRRRYDHRFRNVVHQTGDIELAVRKGMPRSTARDWSRLAPSEVLTFDIASMSEQELRKEVTLLRERNARLQAILRLIVVLLKVFDVSMVRRRLPSGQRKRALLRAVDRSTESLPLRKALRLLGLSKSRYYSWRREEEGELDDASSCPRAHPQQLTTDERSVVREIVTSEEFRHVPTATLAILAQRLGKVFASPSTWHRLVRTHGWRRPRKRVHPAKPRLGIRASAPNEIWHIDTSVVRLIDGSHAYFYAVIDNYSRRILAWRVSENFDPTNTLAILLEAGGATVSTDSPPTLFADSGVENRTKAIDELVNSGALRRIFAQTEIACSNSMIEAWWRTLKHQWLFLNNLDSVCTIRHLVDLYTAEHNTRLPHSAFHGQTPDEMYFGTGTDIPGDLDAKRKEARAARIVANRERACRVCS
jgi:putative transposase